VADSLRFWIEEMHVDGFRFDLAAALGRESNAFDPSSGFLDVLRQDPVIASVKLIAEPWDATGDGYQLGRFPPGWAEWNDRYRNDVRRFWRGDASVVPALATRLSGSTDVFAAADRQPSASVNFVTAHDGFTLADLVAYSHKHNEMNGEDNRDGDNQNHSFNCGAEGETHDVAVLALRRRQRQNLLTTLFLSLGVPMLSGGDEFGRSQSGNNNAYTHDSVLSWTSWNTDEETLAFVRFVQNLTSFRRAQPVLRRRGFLAGTGDPKDVTWLAPDGREMTGDDWNDHERRALAMLLDGRAIREPGPKGEPITGASVAALFNAGDVPVRFTLPTSRWTVAIDTTSSPSAPVPAEAVTEMVVGPQAVVVCVGT
jgi:glycogen operon protein